MLAFKDRVIEVIKKIPKGRVTNYGTVALLAGLPRGARLVGGILHFAPESLSLPWYRVVNKDGFISTRCPEHSKELQKVFLEQEGIVVSKDFMVDLSKYGWWG